MWLGLRTGSAAILAIGAVASSGSAQNSAAPENFRLEMSENFIAMSPGHWEASGAFSDSGTIQDVPKHDIQGSTVTVIGTLAGTKGSFTMKWRRVNRFAPGENGNPAALTSGAWQMVSGTGAYSGIRGQGIFKGTINFETGEVHDVWTGHVDVTRCQTYSAAGVQICSL